jgi:bile acid-coenzyme A ligase
LPAARNGAACTRAVGPRDDSGKVRRTLLRDERAAWLKEGRAFRIMPSRASAKLSG